jgi:F0F1-type ATP synthase membrane subunit b/b'
MKVDELREENEALRQFNGQNQAKIEEMVRSYTEEIEKLKEELNMIRL